MIESIYRSTLMANMAGQLQIRADVGPRALAVTAPRAPFLDLQFQEAIDDFMRRGVVTPAQWRAMDADARTRAFTATLLATDSLRRTAHAQIARALEEGTTLREFSSALRSGEVSLGVTPSDPAYLETVFRTNIATAYSAGRVQQMGSPEVLAARPYVQIRAIIDGRTTSICRYLNGLTFDRRTDPGWSRFAAPNHFSCRTTEVVLSAAQVSPSQIIHSSDVDSRGQPADGFDGPPTLSLEE